MDYIGVLVGYWGYIGVMLRLYGGYVGVILGLYRDTGKENGNSYTRGLNEASTSGSRLPCGKSST